MSTQVETIATVVKIHRDDPEELYVTVRDASGQERQTLLSYCREARLGVIRPSRYRCDTVIDTGQGRQGPQGGTRGARQGRGRCGRAEVARGRRAGKGIGEARERVGLHAARQGQAEEEEAEAAAAAFQGGFQGEQRREGRRGRLQDQEGQEVE